MALRLAATLLIAISAGASLAATAQDGLRPLPPVLREVTDEAGLLSGEQAAGLAGDLGNTLRATGVPVVVAITPSTRPESIAEYGQRLARRWRQDRGLDPARMVLVVVAVEEAQMQVLPGRGLRLTEALHRDDPTVAAGALFAQDRYYEGLLALSGAIRGVILRARPGR